MISRQSVEALYKIYEAYPDAFTPRECIARVSWLAPLSPTAPPPPPSETHTLCRLYIAATLFFLFFIFSHTAMMMVRWRSITSASCRTSSRSSRGMASWDCTWCRTPCKRVHSYPPFHPPHAALASGSHAVIALHVIRNI